MLMPTARIEPRPPAQQASAISITSIPTATDCAQLDNRVISIIKLGSPKHVRTLTFTWSGIDLFGNSSTLSIVGGN